MTQTATHIEEPESFQYKYLEVDWPGMRVTVDGCDVHLTPIEFRLLSALVRRRGWVLTYEHLLREVWGPSYVADRANLKLYIWYLRRKVERDPSKPELIHTRRGIGYIFAPRQGAHKAMNV